jgi:hypothetical protein
VPFLDSLYKAGDKCTFGFTLKPQNTGKIPFILGDASMRAAYMVFDFDTTRYGLERLLIAVPIGQGQDAVPDVPGCGESIDPMPTSSVYGRPPIPKSRKQEDYVY